MRPIPGPLRRDCHGILAPMIRVVLLLMMILSLAGCATVVRNASDRFSSSLSTAVLDSDDPATIRDALPAYLLLLDSLVTGQDGKAGDASTLLAAARLNGAYAGNFTGADKPRARILSRKAFAYARRATCLLDTPLCAAIDQGPEQFAKLVEGDGKVESMYVLATSWAGFLQANSDDAGVLADLPKVQSLLDRVAAIDPVHDHGQVHVYLGVLNSLRPEAVGGKPEVGRLHFEKAIEISGDRNLMAKALFAEFYARLVFDQALHDRLLNEVLAADPVAPGFTLTNTLAQSRARELLESGKDYF